MLTPRSDDTWRMPLTSEQAALDALIWSWGECYEIGIDDTGQWWYRRRDGKGGRQTARNPDDLRIQVTSDYMFLPIRPPPAPSSQSIRPAPPCLSGKPCRPTSCQQTPTPLPRHRPGSTTAT